MPFGIDLVRLEYRFGDRVVAGLTWEFLLIIAFVAALVFLIHFIVREFINPTGHSISADESTPEEVERRLKNQEIESVRRFTVAQRASHWIMAISIFLLLLSGFLIMHTAVTVNPPLGLSWLTIHEIAAIVLIGYVVFHVGHVAYKGTWKEMWFGARDIEDQLIRLKNFFGLTETYPRQFKYPGAQKILHWSVTATTLGLILTGFVLLRRVNFEPLWSATRGFTFLGIEFGLGTAESMGLVAWSFVLHDFFAMATVALIMGHIYFALRPQEWVITRSMITGSVPVEEYAHKYAPDSWQVGNETTTDGGHESSEDDK